MPIGANVNSKRSQYKHETIFFPPSMLLLLDSVLNSDKNPTNRVKSRRRREVLLNNLGGDCSFLTKNVIFTFKEQLYYTEMINSRSLDPGSKKNKPLPDWRSKSLKSSLDFRPRETKTDRAYIVHTLPPSPPDQQVFENFIYYSRRLKPILRWSYSIKPHFLTWAPLPHLLFLFIYIFNLYGKMIIKQ